MKVPDYFKEDLFSTLGSVRPDYRWFLVGPARSGSAFHQGIWLTNNQNIDSLDLSIIADPNRTAAWNALISGRKRWILFPPHVLPPGMAIKVMMIHTQVNF